ncbi:hypothetical protein BH10ACI1_BH10ACI1_15500 [soil metagenome]
MAFGFFGYPARFTKTRTFQLAEDEIFAVVKSAFENLGWLAYTYREGEGFHKQLKNSPLTWGEEFTVKLLPGGVICAESKSQSGGWRGLPMIFDFGANRKNVETFFAQIEIDIKEHSAK